MTSKSFRREMGAYAVCGMIGATVFAAGYVLDSSDGVCSLLHPKDALAQADCRASATTQNRN